MNILSLDLGTHYGWACTVSGEIHSGHMKSKVSRFEGGGMRFMVFRKHLNTIRNQVMNTYIDAVYFEEVRRHKGVDAAHVYGGFLAVLTAWCEDNSIPYAGVPVGTIKKHATGNGGASKNMVMNAVSKRLGKDVTDDNEADALALLYYAMENGIDG